MNTNLKEIQLSWQGHKFPWSEQFPPCPGKPGRVCGVGFCHGDCSDSSQGQQPVAFRASRAFSGVSQRLSSCLVKQPCCYCSGKETPPSLANSAFPIPQLCPEDLWKVGLQGLWGLDPGTSTDPICFPRKASSSIL